jgi:VWFA-related protein
VKGLGGLPVAEIVGCVLAVASSIGTLADANSARPYQRILHSTTRLVVVNVVVQDKKGMPVEDLTRDDFTVSDGGKKESISIYSFEPARTIKAPLEALPPNTYSNHLAREGRLPTSATVILLDGLGTKFEDLAWAQKQLIKFLSQLQPQDRVALYVLGRKLRVVQDFTSDPSPLLEALRHGAGTVGTRSSADQQSDGQANHFPGLSGPAAAAANRLEAGMVDWTHAGPEVNGFLLTCDSIEAIARHLSGLPGRKSLIWVTGDVPFPQTFSDRFEPGHPGGSNPLLIENYERMVQALIQADVAVYPVDARGLFTDPAFSAENEGRLAPAGSALGALTAVNLAMHYYAQQTGGKAFCNTNDLKGSLRTALDESEWTYTIGYYPTHGHWNGRYRPVKISVNRKGLELHYRQGYFASAEAPLEKTDQVDLLKEGALSPLDATSLGVTVSLEPPGISGDGHLKFTIYVDSAALTFRPANGTETVQFDVWAGQYSNKGNSLGGVFKTVSAAMNEQNYQKVMRAGGLKLTLDDKAESGADELRVVVRDVPSGSMGSLHVPLRQLLLRPSRPVGSPNSLPE